MTHQRLGTFGWNELATRDLPAAKTFYSALFGWTLKDDDKGPGGQYTLIWHGDREIGGMYPMDGPQFEGVPPHWVGYVGVTSAEATASRATDLGGQIVLPPMAVPDVGHIAVVTDPTGATVALYQEDPPKQGGGPAAPGPGAFCWNELMTRDTAAAESFYTELFGWTVDTRTMAHGPYTSFMVDGCAVGGMMAMPPDVPAEVPAHWMGYVMVEDCDASAQRAAELGGTIHHPPTDVPEVGRFAVLADPTGGVLSIIKLVPALAEG